MTPVAPAGAKAPPPNTARRASASQRTAPGRRRKLSESSRGPVPRRVSGPVAAPALEPPPQPDERLRRRRPGERPTRPRPAARPIPRQSRDRRAPRRTTARTQERLAAFLRSLPDHPLLDRVVRGRAWIPLLGVMLVGIVAMQVELLKLNANTGRSIELIGSLQGHNDVLRAQVASASDPNRIERLASRMGMTMPGPEAITFLRARSASVRLALARISVPNVAAFEAALRASNPAAALPATSPSPTPAPATAASQGAQTGNTGAQTTGAQITSTGAQATGTQTTNTGAQTTTTTPTNTTAATAPGSAGAATSTPSAPPATVP